MRLRYVELHCMCKREIGLHGSLVFAQSKIEHVAGATKAKNSKCLECR